MDREADFFLPSIVLDPESVRPLCQQIRGQMESAIRSRTHDRIRLPSSRILARILGVSRNTVLAAYDDLAADGLIQGRRGAGMLVVARSRPGAIDPRRILREAQYPTRMISFTDPDGTESYLTY